MAKKRVASTNTVEDVEVVDIALGDPWGVCFEVEALGLVVVELF